VKKTVTEEACVLKVNANAIMAGKDWHAKNQVYVLTIARAEVNANMVCVLVFLDSKVLFLLLQKGLRCEFKFKCPKDCSKNGECLNGKCFCSPGWEGEDCATNV
jgi:hypothetical protein